jgi:hypothetical protein
MWSFIPSIYFLFSFINKTHDNVRQFPSNFCLVPSPPNFQLVRLYFNLTFSVSCLQKELFRHLCCILCAFPVFANLYFKFHLNFLFWLNRIISSSNNGLLSSTGDITYPWGNCSDNRLQLIPLSFCMHDLALGLGLALYHTYWRTVYMWYT